jgi:hypothetical protein
MNALLTALMTKTSGSALSTDVGGRIYLDRAPAGVSFPYVVFFIVSNVPEKTFSEVYENVIVQFSLFSSSQSAIEITYMHSHLKALFDECSMTISGSTLVWMKRTNLVTMVEDMDTPTGMAGVKHWAVDFEIKTSLN